LAFCCPRHKSRPEGKRLLKKVKRRYLALEIVSCETCNSNEFMDTVWKSISKLYGEHGASTVNLHLISFNDEEKSARLRVGHTSLELLKTALASITKVGDKPAAVHVLRVSGTIKALHSKL